MSKSDLHKSFQVDKGSVAPMPRIRSTLSSTQPWGEEEEEDMADIPMMGAMKTAMAEDPVVTMEDNIGDLHLEGQQTSVTSP